MKPQDYAGTPYADFDCFALVREVARTCFNIVYPTLEEHSPTPRAVTATALIDKRWVEIAYQDRKAGDVMTLSPTPATAGHVGIVIESGWVLHNDKKYGAIIQDDLGLRRRGFLYRKVYRWLA